MTEFAGWEMPVFYSSIRDEHLHTRSAVGLFDLCHMGRIVISGAAFRDFLDWVTPAPVYTAQPGRVLYSFLLNDQGGVIDDITIYFGQASALLVVNAANRSKDYQWLSSKSDDFPTVSLRDLSDEVGMLAVQGPSSDEAMSWVLGKLFQPCLYYTFAEISRSQLAAQGFPDTSELTKWWDDTALIYSATGYTGEHGYEIYAPNAVICSLWDRLLSHADDLKLKPIGLGARDSLRLEACMPLYGHELSEDVTPLEAGLGRFIDFTKPTEFIGRDALERLRQGNLSRKLVGLEINGRGPIPRSDCVVCNQREEAVGRVTSGGYAPSLDKNVALAYVEGSYSHVGEKLFVEIRNRLWEVSVVKRPFYRRSI